MQQRELGRSGLKVSALGLGTGGHSRLGLRRGARPDDAVRVVRRARELGISYIDTAPAYRTEEAVGEGLRGERRDEVVISTKVLPWVDQDRFLEPEQLRRALHDSLDRLGMDHVDVFFLHGVRPDDYDRCASVLVPELLALRDEGKLRAIGLTESFANDPWHEAQHRALDDDCWDVIMTGFNVLNPSARTLFRRARERGVGAVVMHASRWLLADDERLRVRLDELRLRADDPVTRERADDARQRLARFDGAGLFPAAAYRFCLADPDVGSVLIGTGNPSHLEANVAALAPLGERGSEIAAVLDAMDGLLEGVPEGSADPSS